MNSAFRHWWKALVPFLGVLVVLAGLAMPAGAAQSPDDAAAVKALKSQIRLLSDGATGKAWLQLHPVQQETIPRTRYVQCASKQSISVTELKVKDVYHEQVVIPGTSVTADSTAITVSLTGSVGGKPSSTQTATFHEFKVGKTWRFAVADPSIYAPSATC